MSACCRCSLHRADPSLADSHSIPGFYAALIWGAQQINWLYLLVFPSLFFAVTSALVSCCLGAEFEGGLDGIRPRWYTELFYLGMLFGVQSFSEWRRVKKQLEGKSKCWRRWKRQR